MAIATVVGARGVDRHIDTAHVAVDYHDGDSGWKRLLFDAEDLPVLLPGVDELPIGTILGDLVQQELLAREDNGFLLSSLPARSRVCRT